jgi:hypothetical protein
MSEPQNFNQFWDFYVAEHSRPETRIFHFVGSMLGVATLVWLIVSGNWYLFPLALVPAYAMAWVSHFFIEHNKPATFKYPLWSFAGDWVMVWMMLQGKMSAEVERVCGKEKDAKATV